MDALQAAQQNDSSDDESIGGVATLKDVLFEYGTITAFSDSYAASSMGRLSLWFDDSDQAFSNLALIGASNA